ncbi:ABC transporter ATP-binding protein [Peribacillus loiseleuriae]|uniref:ABC transporter ATP-binding protein n=1 Tax=Peribacillus loiseleuriae TaxID=1679170 RepID=UPI003CFE7D9C
MILKNTLQITELNKSFGESTALSQVSFEVLSGQILAVLGPSGCGKTTLLRSITGFELPDSGRIEMGDQTVYLAGQVNIPPEKRFIGYVAQEGALFPHLSVAQNVAFGLPRKLRTPHKIGEMLELVGMAGYEQRMPHELSGGQQQRVALARALAPSPSLVLLDEPFSALDAGLRTSLRNDVLHSLRQTGATAILVTHDQEEALSIADVVAVMKNGQVIQTGSPEMIYHFPSDLWVADFVGEAVCIQADIKQGQASTILGSLPVDPQSAVSSGNAIVMIRPEQFVIGKPGEGITAQVSRKTYFGHDSLLNLQIEHSTSPIEVTSRILGESNYVPGEQVGLKVKGSVMVYQD